MKKITVFISSIFFLFLVSSCQKEIPTQLKGYFYTSDPSFSESPLTLYIDGEAKGSLPYINLPIRDIREIDSSLMKKTLNLEFMSGKHLVQAKTTDGSLVSSSEMTFRFYKNETKSKVSSGIGASGSASFTDKTKVVIWLGSKL